jgi:hypothetical protein
MTVIKGELNDPNSGQVSVSQDFETALVGDMNDYDKDLEYLEVDGKKVEEPLEIEFLNSSVSFRNVAVDDVKHFRYSGREYSPEFFDGVIMETESMRRAPSVVETGNGYEVVDGNSYFEAFRDERDEKDIWVRIHDYSMEEAVDHFLEDHLPLNRSELQEDNWYSDEEIGKTLENLYPDLGTEIDLSNLEEVERIGFNTDRLRYVED